MRRFLRFLVVALALVIVSAVAGGLYLRARLRASLPAQEGSQSVPGLTSMVGVERDALGVPTITGATRADVARALGFVHAQERFFQMDLQRRQPAGELAALVGPRALEADARARIHRARHVARRALELAEPAYRTLLDAYAEGVNAGLGALGAPPFEYLVLRTAPEPWRAEDSILTVLAMFGTLQGRQAAFEQTLGAMRDALPDPLYRFLAAAGSDWETPVVGPALARPPVPGPEIVDLRRRNAMAGKPAQVASRRGIRGRRPVSLAASSDPLLRFVLAPSDQDEAAVIGSNNWAVDGARSASGVALVANDMHLAIGVPIIWYRASLVVPDAVSPAETMRVTGVTLPGLPVVVVGSNGHVAWGFTNTGGDWSDLVRLEPDPASAGRYLTPDGPREFDVFDERVEARGGEPRTVRIRWTIWGPVVAKDGLGREYAQHWVAHDPVVLSADVSRLERSRSVDEVLANVAGLGIPHQNVTAGDRSGRIAWTIGGAIPRRVGLDGVTPESWADGTRRWDGYLTAAEFPRVVDPPDGRIWTANAPVVGGAMLALIGEGGYADGIRARLIRDRLMGIDRATPRDMLGVQLEDRALFLERWRLLLVETLARSRAGSAGAHAGRDLFARLVETTWTGRASPDSAAYLLVRTFRALFVRRVMTALTAAAAAADPGFDYSRSLRGEGPVWQIVTERPMHLLDPAYPSWDDLILAVVDEAVTALTEGGRPLGDRRWGDTNRTEVWHPLASGLPLLGRWLNMPSDPLPGDVYTPRASAPRTGPSERMAVSPGREHEGILHLPTGQSGHPLSPHYGDQYRAWLEGRPTPFLPGPAVSTLTLTPR